MSEHTPGPWAVNEHNDITHAQNGQVAWVRYTYEQWLKETDLANAKLIASAPDLLAERDRLKAENRRLNEALDGLEAKWQQAASDMDSIGVGAWQPEVRQCAKELREARAGIQPQQEEEGKGE